MLYGQKLADPALMRIRLNIVRRLPKSRVSTQYSNERRSRMRCRVLLLVAATWLLVACASSSGVLQMGPDTYTVSVGVSATGSISGNDARAKKKALTEANEFCSKKGKQILVQNTGMSSTGHGSTSEVIFQCLESSDPAMQVRPQYQKAPDVKIESSK